MFRDGHRVWIVGSEAGGAAISARFLVGLLTRAGGVVAMWYSQKTFYNWLEKRKPKTDIQLIVEGGLIVVGLAWFSDIQSNGSTLPPINLIASEAQPKGSFSISHGEKRIGRIPMGLTFSEDLWTALA